MKNNNVSSNPNDTVAIICSVVKGVDDSYSIDTLEVAYGKLDEKGTDFICIDNKQSYECLSDNLYDLEEGKQYYCFDKTVEELRNIYGEEHNINELMISYLRSIFETYNFINKDEDNKYNIHSVPKVIIDKKSDDPIKEIESSTQLTVSDYITKKNGDSKLIEVPKPNIILPDSNSILNRVNLLDFEKYLKERVIGNDKVLENIASTMLLNLSSPNPKLVDNILNIGPTGTGKTYTFELISEYLGVPLIIFNTSSLSTAGYQGYDTNDLLKQVYLKADGDVEKANKAIVILDEIDKLKSSKLEIKEQAQNDLLALLGGSIVEVELDAQRGTTVTLNTKGMTFVGCGAFTELFNPGAAKDKEEEHLDPYSKLLYQKAKEEDEKETKRKLEIKEMEIKRIPIGFHTSEELFKIEEEHAKKLKEYEEEKQKNQSEQENSRTRTEVTDEELIKYGLKRELIGRLPKRNVFANLDAQGLTRVLTEAKESVLNLKKERYLQQFNTELECDKSFIEGVVDLALKENLGGRSLNKVCSQIFERVDRQMLIEEHTEHKVLKLTKKNIELLHEKLLDYEDYISNSDYISKEEYHLNIISKMIKRVHKECKKKNISFGVSPDGNIDNNYNKHMADVKKWMSEDNYIDFIMPQIYYGFYNSTKAYSNVIHEWESLIKNNIDLYVALAFYKVGIEDKYAKEGRDEWILNDNIIMREVILSRNLKNYRGFSLFRYDNLFESSYYNSNSIGEINNLKKII